MDNSVLKLRLANEAKKARINSGIAMLIFTSVFVGLNYLIDNLDWQFRGSGGLVWLVFAICLLYGTWAASTLIHQLNKDASFIPFENLNPVQNALKHSPATIMAWIEEVAEAAGFKKGDYTPILVKDKTSNAFAAGSGSNRVVALHMGLINEMDEAQIKGVLAHKFGHLKNNDIFMLVFCQAAIMAFVYMGKTLIDVTRYGFIFGGSRKTKEEKDSETKGLWWLFLIGLALMLFGYIFAPIISAFMSRKREDMADAFAVATGHGEGLQSALNQLKTADQSTPLKTQVASLYINETAGGVIERIISTHPPLTNRVDRINSMLKGDQGVVPDTLENNIWAAIKWLVLPALGAYIFIVKGCCTDLPGLFGVPFAFIATVVWLFVLDNLLSTVSTKVTDKPSALLMIVGIIFLLGMWAAGFWAISLSDALPAYIVNFTEFSRSMMIFWGIKPFASALSTNVGLAGLLSDLTTYASLGYAIIMLATLVLMASRF